MSAYPEVSTTKSVQANGGGISRTILGSCVWMLEPPYLSLIAVGRQSPALGSAIICDLRGRTSALAEAASLRRAYPWCSTIIAIRAEPPDIKLLESLISLRGALAYCEMRDESDLASVAGEAVRSRRHPGISWFGEFVSGLLCTPSSAMWLVAAVEAQRDVGTVSYRTICRHLNKIGPLSPDDWRAIYRLSELPANRRRTVETAARYLNVDARTLRAHVSRYLGMQTRDFLPRLGCEWVVEHSLRRSGYFQHNEPDSVHCREPTQLPTGSLLRPT